ncbi:hypothetical protein P4378_34100, partial [Bacillus thuringiensis]|nr:hypothetical protein [Bacillus thuringiensis]MED3208482.1 hypothetical protein [Bacillus thuringiensis]MED3289128.1 hypothetical protein [Bacillus thuringiensis]MED3309124.1 hypothetical protein [Bacillus thuringiensis]MED3415204.1 hypothetical protein [Bacillus thuringiensis]
EGIYAFFAFVHYLHQNPYEQIEYTTKTIELFPDTDQVRVDISETEGMFKVESVELICLEG